MSNKQLTPDQIRSRVAQINKTLFDENYSITEVMAFWDNCFTIAKALPKGKSIKDVEFEKIKP